MSRIRPVRWSLSFPDKEIFEETVFDFDILKQRFREMAFLTRGLFIKIRDEREEELIEKRIPL